MLASRPSPILDVEPEPDVASRAKQALGELARARVSNMSVRLGGVTIVALLAALVANRMEPLFWCIGYAIVLLCERSANKGILKRLDRGELPVPLLGALFWTFTQSLYANLAAIWLWLSDYAHAETLAVFYLLAGLSNAAVTLRRVRPLMLAAVSSTLACLLGLPIVEFAVGGFENMLALLPLLAAALFLLFGTVILRSLNASDAALRRAELAATREQAAAEEAASAKAEAMRCMRDETRTPVAALLGAADALRRNGPPCEARARIEAVMQAAETLQAALDDVAAIVDPGAEPLGLDPAPCDPREVARAAVAAFRAAAQDKGLELFLDIDPRVPERVEMDALRVRQILYNLLANAVAYTGHGGVRLRLQARAGSAPGRAQLGFAIADTGRGMSRSQVAQLFGEGRLKAGEGGGLAIARRFADLMGGKLAAKSELGEGAMVSFVLEASIAAAAPPAAPTEVSRAATH